MSPIQEGRLIGLLVAGLWLGWIISWLLAARWFAPVKERAGILRQLPDRLITILGAVLVGFTPPPNFPAIYAPLTQRLFHYGFTTAWILVGFIALGIAVMWWARLYLGSL